MEATDPLVDRGAADPELRGDVADRVPARQGWTARCRPYSFVRALACGKKTSGSGTVRQAHRPHPEVFLLINLARVPVNNVLGQES
jgi:hypothetical protein